jgi:hypothetical protein
MGSLQLCATCHKHFPFEEAQWLRGLGSVCPKCFEDIPKKEVVCGACGKACEFQVTHGSTLEDRICKVCHDKRQLEEQKQAMKRAELEDQNFVKETENFLKGKSCPSCGSDKLALFLWGLQPTSPGFLYLVQKKMIVQGGCSIDTFPPHDLYCFKCKKGFHSSGWVGEALGDVLKLKICEQLYIFKAFSGYSMMGEIQVCSNNYVRLNPIG